MQSCVDVQLTKVGPLRNISSTNNKIANLPKKSPLKISCYTTILLGLPVKMYWESDEKAQSHTHLSVFFLRVVRRLKSAVDHTLHVPSADVVASRLESGLNKHLRP